MRGADDLSVAVPLDGPAVPRTPKLVHECTVAGLRAIALPPGRIELAVTAEWHMLNVVTTPLTSYQLKVGGEKVADQGIAASSVCWQPKGCDLQIGCTNDDWEPIIEVDPLRLYALAHEALGDRHSAEDFLFWRPDPLVGGPTGALLAALRQRDPEPLFVEGLVTAIVARGLRLAAGGLVDAPTRGTDRRIRRAMDYAETHLEEALSLAVLAEVAATGPFHFLRCFRDATARTPAVWVKARRVERAKRLLRRPAPLAEIAFACGFASQSHFGQVFRAHTGMTPGRWRTGL